MSQIRNGVFNLSLMVLIAAEMMLGELQPEEEEDANEDHNTVVGAPSIQMVLGLQQHQSTPTHLI